MNNFELGNSETLDHYEILQEDLHAVCEKEEIEHDIKLSNLTNRNVSVDTNGNVHSSKHDKDSQVYMNGITPNCKL